MVCIDRFPKLRGHIAVWIVLVCLTESGDSKNISNKGVGAVHKSKKPWDVQKFQEQEFSPKLSSKLSSKSENVLGVDFAARDVRAGTELGPSYQTDGCDDLLD